MALARLERDWHARGEDTVTIATKNIDSLHEAGGSKTIFHMHGKLLRARCLSCQEASPWSGDLCQGEACPRYAQAGCLRPHAVWFGEIPLFYAGNSAASAALHVVRLHWDIGHNVYPAADFVQAVCAAGAHTIELNLDPSEAATVFHEAHYGPAAGLIPSFVDEILENGI